MSDQDLKAGESGAARTRTKPGGRIVGTERRMRHYWISSTEMLTLSIVSPAGAMLIGYGVDVYKAWARMPETDPMRETLGDVWMGAIALGGLMVLITWGHFFVIWFQSDPDGGPPALVRLKRRIFG